LRRHGRRPHQHGAGEHHGQRQRIHITSLRKLRFNNITDSGSVTGTLTINANAIAQIRSGGGSQNSLGSGVLLRLNTGINLADTDNSGRLEAISENDANFGNDVILLGDSHHQSAAHHQRRQPHDDAQRPRHRQSHAGGR
jgi:hypothetical protein